MKQAARLGLYNSLGRMSLQVGPPRPNVLIFSSRRSGSTWLSELLATQPRTKRILEPYDTSLNHPHYLHSLPKSRDGFFFDLSRREEEQIFRFYEDMASCRKLLRTQWKLWKPDHHFLYDRMVFKFFYVKDYIAEFHRRYDVRVLYLIRHPVPTALANLKLGWPCTLDAYLQHPAHLERILNGHQLETVARVSSAGTPLERYVLGWFLENWLALQQSRTATWPVLRYEDMVREPTATLELLDASVGLDDHGELEQRYTQPSFNSFDSARRVKSGDAVRITEFWKNDDRVHTSRGLPTIFEAFETPYYRWGEDATSRLQETA